MAEGVDWTSAWEIARSHSPYTAFGVEPGRAMGHWDRMSAWYDLPSVDLIDRSTWEVMAHEGLTSGSGAVLDIGCGTGALTRMLAQNGRKVVGLDISPGMLSLAKDRCSGIDNVELICQDWNDFSSGQRFDLVFSSFCPAVDGLASIMRMESLCSGRCCIVSLSGYSGDRLAHDIWESMGISGMSMECYDPLYPYYVLQDLGREPVLNGFTVREETRISEEDMVAHLSAFISLFSEVGDKEISAIEAAVSCKADQGRFDLQEERTVSVLQWAPGVSARSGPL